MWYTEAAWRLGIIRDVVMQESNFHKKQYRIAPAGHMILGQQDVIKKAEEMRPYLSFSIPLVSDEARDYLGDKTYDQVDWVQFGTIVNDGLGIKVETSCSNNKKTRASASAGANAIRNRPPEWLGADLGGNAQGGVLPLRCHLKSMGLFPFCMVCMGLAVASVCFHSVE